MDEGADEHQETGRSLRSTGQQVMLGAIMAQNARLLLQMPDPEWQEMLGQARMLTDLLQLSQQRPGALEP